MDNNQGCNSCELRKFVIPEIVSGINAGLLIGRYLEHFGSRNPMIVTDPGVRKSNWFVEIEREISSHVKSYIIFDGTTPNPKDKEVMAGTEIFLKNRCDLIVAVGGGSPMDCAKGICIVSTNGGHILDYEGVDQINLPGPPLICIPTTSGSSADVSQFAIIMDTKEKIKKAIISKMVVPDLALIDPVPLMDMSLNLTACTAMDALTHAIEAYVSNAQSALTDVHALEAIGIISENIELAVSDKREINIMCKMMLGSIEAGIAFSNASLGAVHAMAHSMGGLYDLPHGECNSILLEHVVEYNFNYAPERYIKIAERMGLKTNGLETYQIKKNLIGSIRKMRENVGIKEFVNIGNAKLDYEFLVDSALMDPCMITNPRTLTREEVKALYERVIRKEK